MDEIARRLNIGRVQGYTRCVTATGSFLLANGMDLATVSERLGHSSVRVTADVYSHAIRGRDQEAARSWDEFMRLQGGAGKEPHKVI